MSLRSDQLFGLADRLTSVHHAWVASPHEQPTPEYWDSVDNLLDAFDAGDIPSDCRDLAAAVDRLHAETGKYEQALVLNDKARVHGGFFDARQGVEDSRHRQLNSSKPPLESIDELIRQNVGNRQIAKMWGIEIHQVEAYRQDKWKPEEGYLPPSERERLASISAAEMEAAARSNAKAAAAVGAPAACPETVEELLRQNVSFKQIAKMKGVSEGDVLGIAKTLGLAKGQEAAGEPGVASKSEPSGDPVLPSHLESGAAPESPEHTPAESAESPAETESPTESANGDGNDQASVEADVLALAGEGYEVPDIASAVGLNKRQVNAILRRNKVEVGAAA